MNKVSAVQSTSSLVDFAELKQHPKWSFLADNADVHTGYRIGMSFKDALSSLFTLHNETFNVWSHLLGTAMFVALLLSFLYEMPAQARQQLAERMSHAAGDVAGAVENVLHAAEASIEGQVHDRLTDAFHLPHATALPLWPLAVFLASAIFCLGASAVYHLLYIIDEQWFVALSSLDYTGIGILIYGSTLPVIWPLGFFCHPRLGGIYAAVGTVLLLGTVYVGLSPSFRTTEYRLVRMGSFIASGCYGVIPFAHLVALGERVYPEALPRLLQMGGLYIFGALLYGFRVPERYFPGRFDLAFQSHNIFHLCVWAAVSVHYYALTAHYAWRAANTSCDAAAAPPEV